jgi:XTP/dITP diphosphohydrolase
MLTRLLIATHNRGKLQEYGDLLGDVAVELVAPEELGLDLAVQETGETYRENAVLKAKAYAQASGLLTLADDSGLEVDALDGAPGVRSARYAPGRDTDRVTTLLQALEEQEVPKSECTARFRCVIVVVEPGGGSWSAEGVCEGRIIEAPRGTGGFGYDPIFYLPDRERTMAQLSSEEKNRISHRARAVQAIKPLWDEIIQKAGRR